MGVIRFRLPANDLNRRISDCRAAYFTGLDRTPGHLKAEFRNGMMICHRESTESGRLFVPWHIEGQGIPIIGTATLAERAAPHNLAVELARGKLNDVRNQLADWRQLGLSVSDELNEVLVRSQRAFVKAATGRYVPGRRAWVKVNSRQTHELIVGRVLGPIQRPDVVVLGRYRSDGRLVILARSVPLSDRQTRDVSSVLRPPVPRMPGRN